MKSHHAASAEGSCMVPHCPRVAAGNAAVRLVVPSGATSGSEPKPRARGRSINEESPRKQWRWDMHGSTMTSCCRRERGCPASCTERRHERKRTEPTSASEEHQ